MSNSDDTDELLLIPPDFFLIESDSDNLLSSVSDSLKVVDTLITQVNDLDQRLSYIESLSSNTSLLSVSEEIPLDDIYPESLMHRNCKYNSFEDLGKVTKFSYWSTQSTPSSQREKSFNESYTGNDLNPRKVKAKIPSHEKSPIKYFHLSPRVKTKCSDQKNTGNPKVLSEIDNFITNVKNIQKFKENNSSLHLQNVNKIEKDIEQCSLTNKKIDKWKSVPRNLFPSDKSNYYEKVRSWQSSTEKSLQGDDSQQTSEEVQKQFPETINEEDESSILSNSSTQITALQTLNQQKSLEQTSQNVVSNFLQDDKTLKQPEQFKRSSETIFSQSNLNSQGDGTKYNLKDIPKPNSHLAFLSLQDLWKKNIDNFSEGDAVLLKKVEEERLMRKHCEEVIQQQQKQILDMEERLAVAIQVDQAKDETIDSFYREWYKMQSKLKHLEEESQFLKKKLEIVEEEKKIKLSESVEKLKTLENEASKALNLAHSSQEKTVNLEKEILELQNKLQASEEKCKNFELYFTNEKKKNQQLLELLNHKDSEINENKKSLATAKNELMQNQRTIEVCQGELTLMKTRMAQLEGQLEDEKEWNKDFELQKKKFQVEIEAHQKTEANLREEIKKLKEVNEKAKVQLRNFYQDQVEAVVREKLKEFQAQLEKAENNLQFELKAQEKSFAKAAAAQIFQITEKHNMEIQLLEERHQEEIRLYKLQLSQSKQQLDATKAKLQRQQERIVEQLYKAMEAQWIEALKVIGGNSPTLQNDHTLNQLNYFKNRSYNSFERILSQNVDQVLASDNVTIQRAEEMGSEKTCRRENNMLHETPLSSRTQKSKQEIENELQKYIQAAVLEQNSDPNSYKYQKPTQKDAKQQKPPWK